MQCSAVQYIAIHCFILQCSDSVIKRSEVLCSAVNYREITVNCSEAVQMYVRSLPPTADPAGRRGAACANQQVPIRAAPVSDTEAAESGWLPREEARLAGRGGVCHLIWTRGGIVQYPGVSKGVSLG